MKAIEIAGPWIYRPVPSSAIRLFQMVWQLEAWLRLFVYVELRTAFADWEEPIKRKLSTWPPSSLVHDKRLHHMATAHSAVMSYLTFGQLWNVISDDSNWPLFEAYFPPKSNIQAKIEEVMTIRNRVAHFRNPHPQDEMRLELFMRDMEVGVKRFCVRYTTPARPDEGDKVLEQLEELWEVIGYGVELLRPDRSWLYAPEPLRSNPRLNADLMTCRSRRSDRTLPDTIYRLVLHASRSGHIDPVQFYDSTKSMHRDIVHILLSPPDEITLTIPAVLGTERVVEIIERALSAGHSSARECYSNLEDFRSEWPEYVLWPDHVLTIFDEDIRDPLLLIP